MSRHDISQAKSPELRGSLDAMRRAGKLARQRAIQTNTNLVVVEDGKVIRVSPDQLRREMREENRDCKNQQTLAIGDDLG